MPPEQPPANGRRLPRRSRSRVLLELRKVRQIPGEPRRRWFQSRTFDLVVWYEPTGEVHGFQLCYRRGAEEHALTWTRDEGYLHHRVDDGEDLLLRIKMTPILVPDGVFDRARVLELFEPESRELEPELAALVIARLKEYAE